ncbi:UDP-xylose and UDP-N-acetylglucosamine transporter-like [Athalia rosae]|uniref:UDP-xylose and UDP-N-acetylglucosamine transporter-like n=1 Tax=Athalia rosae TaxID=37344 RepID=UPI0020336177|nr:UDP-xylose and UDP-N-acetylglucosamine transporter-like [Athalia rosae]
MKEIITISLVILGCCVNVIFLELLIQEDPGSGNLITFSQFFFIALKGFIFTSKCGTVKPTIGLKKYMTLVVMFFLASVCKNYALDFNVPMPLNIIFSAGSLIANIIMGMIILKKKYVFSKYMSVCLITFGILMCTVASGKDVKSTRVLQTDSSTTEPWNDFYWWIFGIALLTVALFISARMGIYQEVLYARHGKHAKEALFYTHLLPLPFFSTLATNIRDHFLIAIYSDSLYLPIIRTNVPKSIVYLVGNVVTQYICISSVYVLTTECTSLTVTLVVTLRKFVSLLFSVVYFSNPFTIHHWIGTLLVLVGTIIFTEMVPKIKEHLRTPSKLRKIK